MVLVPMSPFSLEDARRRGADLRKRRAAGGLTLALFVAFAIGLRGPTVFTESPITGTDKDGSHSASSLDRELLPADVAPTHYQLELELDPEASTTFFGRLSVEVMVSTIAGETSDTTGSSVISLHARNMTVSEKSVVFLSRAEPGQVYHPEVELDPAAEIMTLRFNKPLPVGEGTLQLKYTGVLGNTMAGLYRSEYEQTLTAEGSGAAPCKRSRKVKARTAVMAMTQFEAIDARRMLPCWDEPSRKATFSLSVAVPRGLMAVSNMPSAEEVFISSGLQRQIRFMDTPKMSTYLLALAVGDFDSIQRTTSRGTLIRVLTAPGKSQLGRFALDVAARALDLYSDYFGVPYPLPKLDMLAAPDFAAGAMENWGLVIYREVDLLCNATTVSVARRMRIATVVTHELAHMWFGNLVTMEWWDQLWLNEGFANWMQTYAADVLFPEWAIWEQYVVQEQSQALALDALRSSHPIEVPILRAQEVDEVFDAISYSKGGSVVRMLHAFLGDRDFRSGLALYMKMYAYKNTVTTDLWKCWEEVSGKPIEALMESWTRQQGFPYVTVKELQKSLRHGPHDRELLFTQRWFLADGSVEDADQNMLWTIPLLPGPETGDEQNLMTQREFVWTAPANPSWFKLNFGQMAPYRVLYDSPRLRESLAQALRNGEVQATDRIGLLLDSLAFARQGRLSVADLLRLLSGFTQENNTYVWEALSSVLATLHRAASFVADSSSSVRLVDKLEAAMVTALLGPALKECGWWLLSEDGADTDSLPIKDESDLVRQRRALLVGLAARYMLRDPAVAKEALLRFTKWFSAPASADRVLPDDLKGSVFKIVLANGRGSGLYRKLRRHARRAETPQAERLNIYLALGATGSENLRLETLDMVTNSHSGVRLQDLMYLVHGVAATDPQGAQLAWRWFARRHEVVRRRLSGANIRLLGAVIDAATRAVPDDMHADDVEAFFVSQPVHGLERSIAQTVESIRTEAKFVARLESTEAAADVFQALDELEAQAHQ